MNRVTKFFMQRPTLFWSMLVGMLLAGLLAFAMMPKLEDPAVAVKQAMVIVPYPGADAHKMELEVAQVMEDRLRTLPDVKKITTECSKNMATFAVEFEMSVLLEDLEEHFEMLRRKVRDVRSQLPSGCYDPIVVDDMMDVYGMFFALTSDGYDYTEMERYAKMLRRELLAVKGVKRVIISGNRDEVINITLSKEQLAANGIVPAQIMMALQKANAALHAGNYEVGDERLQIRIGSAVTNEKDIAALRVKSAEGKIVRLGDIARIERAYAKPQTGGFFVDGKPALALCLSMQAGTVVTDVGKAVDKRLAEVSPRLPAGLEMEKIFFQPEKVSAAINTFLINLCESVAIVVLVLIFTMGWRSGAIIGFGLVLTIAVSFPILLMCDTTLQRISLGAFIVAMGMLVDNSIVIMDGILVDKAKGLPQSSYLFRIGSNTAMPLLGATIIAASAFIAVYLSPDSAGEYARDLFLVLCVSLLASWFLALVQVPICARSWLPASGGGKKEAAEGKLHKFVRRTISLFIAHKAATIATACVLLVVSGVAMTKVKNLFFPDFDYKQFIVEYSLPPQTSPDRVRKDLLRMTGMLKKRQGIERITACMGSVPARYCLVRPMTNGGDSYGELLVDCKDYEEVVRQIPEVRRLLREAFPDATIRLRKYNFSIATSHTVEVRFSGPDPAVLRQLSAQAEDVMRRSPYVDAFSVQNNWKPMGKTLNVDYRREAALYAGLERSDVANALLAATDGMPVGVINDKDKAMLINLHVRNADGSAIKRLNDIPAWSTLNVRLSQEDASQAAAAISGKSFDAGRLFRSTPLSAVSDSIRLGWEEPLVVRLNGQRTIEAECDPDGDRDDATPEAVLADIRAQIDSIPLPEGYERQWAGEQELQGTAVGTLLRYLPITVFIVLLILLLLFDSWRKVLLIIICFPFTICGIAPLLLAFNRPFTFMAIVGLLGLIGMVVKNAIVLMDEINRLTTEEGIHPYYALLQATASRVRPVTMASLTTILGMLPLVNDPMYGSMALTIMGGLTMGTLITLALLPLFYAALFRIKKPAEK